MDNNLNNIPGNDGTPVNDGSAPVNGGTPADNSYTPAGNSSAPADNSYTQAGNSYIPAGNGGEMNNAGATAGNADYTGAANTAGTSDYTGAANNGGILNGYVMNADPGYTQSFAQGNPDGSDPQQSKKKSKALPIVLGAVGVVVVAAVVLGVVFRGVLANSWARMTKSPEEYTRYVLEKNLLDNDMFWKGYEDSYKQVADLKGMKISGETRLELSKDVINMIEDAYTDYQNRRYSFGGYSGYKYYDAYMEYVEDQWDKDNYDYLDYDEWEKTYDPSDSDDGGAPAIQLGSLSDIALIYEVERDEDAMRGMQALQLSDKEYLLTLNEIYDSDKHELYLQMPEINKDYAKLELEDIADADELDELDNVLFGSDMKAVMMDPKTAKSVTNRYFEILVSKIDDVEEKKDTFEAAGEEQKCVALKFMVDEDLIRETGIELCETMSDDDEIRRYFSDYVKNYLPTEDADDMWEEMADQLKQAAEDLEDADIDTEFECTLYVDNLGQIIGVKMLDDKEENGFLCGYVVKKGKLNFELSCTVEDEEVVNLEGIGKLTKSGVTADFDLTIRVQGLKKKITFALENMTTKGGVFTMDLNQFYKLAQLAGAVDDDIDDYAKLIKDATLRIEYHSDNKKVDGSIGILNDGDKVAAISWKTEVANSGGIEMPSSKECEKITDEDEMVEYLLDSDLDVFVDKLEELGLPQEAADDLREEFEDLEYYY